MRSTWPDEEDLTTWTDAELRGAIWGFAARMDRTADVEKFFTLRRKYDRLSKELLRRHPSTNQSEADE